MDNTSEYALIIVDVQNDFCPGGALAVNGGHEIVPIINKMAAGFSNVVITQDWHPAGHISFASTHGKNPFSAIQLDYGSQVMWPDHCVQGAKGAELHPGLDVPHAQLILRKGYRVGVDSYSAFTEADKVETGLAAYLNARGIKKLFVVGLATDFCVAWTAMDARLAGFEVTVVEDACRAIDVDGSLAGAWKAMTDMGVIRG